MRVVALLVSSALCLGIALRAQADPADNVRTAKRVFLETLAAGRFDRLNQIYGPNFIAHGAGANYSLEQDTAATRTWRTAMPDIRVTVERTVAARELVAVHWSAVGTNTVAAGEMPGKGERIGIEGMTFLRFSAGRIVEEWSVIDVATLRKQLSQGRGAIKRAG
jgi:predicted ester cyclase